MMAIRYPKSIVAALGLSIVIALFFSCENNNSLEFKRYYSEGAAIYQTHCLNCHAADGSGLLALIPALNDSTFLKNNKASLACAIRYGLKRPIKINGKAYDENMPAANLAPMEIAQVITYMNNSFGNQLGMVTMDEVETDLKSCK